MEIKMGYTNFPNGITSMGVPVIGGGIPVAAAGTYWFVSADTDIASDGNSGRSLSSPLLTVQRAVNLSSPGDVIMIAPGEYDEAVTIARTGGITGTLNNLTFYGYGNRGAAYIAPSTTNAVAVTNHADDVTFVNVGLDGDGTGAGLINTGSRLRVYGCKLEGDDIACQMTLGTVAQEAAGTRGVGADCLFDQNCEFAWASQGLLITCTDYGAVTELQITNSNFHDNSAAAIDESVGSGGSAAVLFQGLRINNCIFNDAQDGTAPTAFILLNDNNANAGIVTQCAFPSAINSGKNLVSTALHWVSNFHTGGVSTGQPS
jgi:hypothetical protein